MHRLPNGKTTKDDVKYVNSWRSLADGIKEGMGVRLAAFDPDLSFVRPDGTTFEVPVDLAVFINQLIDGQAGG